MHGGCGNDGLAHADSYWAIQAERAEVRTGNAGEVLALGLDAYRGTDEFKLRYASEIEYQWNESRMEAFEHRVMGQVPISDFFDAKAGVRLDTPKGRTVIKVFWESRDWRRTGSKWTWTSS